MYHIIICDDDNRFIDYIKKIIEAFESKQNIQFYEFESGEMLIEQLPNIKECDLCILDMQLKLLDGDMTARNFRKFFPLSVLVFCSGIYQPTTRAFETEAFRYLLKSYTEEHMSEEIKQILDRVRKKKRISKMSIQTSEGIYGVNPQKILYIENYRRGSQIHLYLDKMEKAIITKKKLSEFYEILKEYEFAYAHNSYIVNTNYITVLKHQEILMIDGTILSVSRSRIKELKKIYIAGMDKYE